MDVLAIGLALLGVVALAGIGFGLYRWLVGAQKSFSAHTDARSDQARSASPVLLPPPPLPPQPPATAPEASESISAPAGPGPVVATVLYTKVDGTTSERTLTVHSRILRDGRTVGLNCRQMGEQRTKQFLLSGIQSLRSAWSGEPVELVDPDAIRQWLDASVPERRQAQPRPSGLASVPDAIPALPPPPQLTPPPLPPLPPPPQVRPQLPPPLNSLLPDGASGFAVLDLETTGIGRSCRIVEIALVRLDPEGRITEEWETLVNPGVPIPNADIHGISDEQVAGAPSFAEIAGLLAAKLHAHVLVAHNLRGFDGPVLEAHFAAVDAVTVSLGQGVDTMPSPRRKLADLCAQVGVELSHSDAHTALGDTRALAAALQRGLAHLQPAEQAVIVSHNGLLAQPCAPLTRAMVPAPVQQWQPVWIELKPELRFVSTGPPSMKANTAIKQAEAYGIGLGLSYRKVSAIAKRQPPDFLLSTSLTLETRKMREAREQQVPVVLCRDLQKAQIGSRIQAWVHGSAAGEVLA